MEKSEEKLEAVLDSEEVPLHYNFYHYFGTVLTDVYRFFKRELKWFHKFPKKFMKMELPASFEDSNKTIEAYIPIWATLKTYTHGRICFHVYKMFYSLTRDPEFYTFSKYERNILLWAVLFHDICKRGTPVVEGKDPIHPFKGAHLMLHYLRDTFKFVNLTDEDLKQWDAIFENGYHKIKGKDVQNHFIIPDVHKFLKEKLKEKRFERELILYVLLHQSYPTLKDHPHESLLEPLDVEPPKYINKKMINVFRIFLKHDSFSYLIFSPKVREQFGKEIEENMQKLAKAIDENAEEKDDDFGIGGCCC